MKLTENRTLKVLHIISSLVLGFYFIFLLSKLFSIGAPALSNSVKGYSVYDLIAKPKELKYTGTLEDWFHNKIIVQPTYTALVDIRFKSYTELFSLPALSFQVSLLIYWLSIGYLLLCIKMLFHSFSKGKVFTTKNANLITSGAIVMLALPIIRWSTKELFINCITNLNLSDPNYNIQNAFNILGTETLIGFALLAFGLAFREGVIISNENEKFI